MFNCINLLEDLRTCAFIFLSATAYLLDFGGNIAAGVEYFKFAHLHPDNRWIPITFLTMILVAHALTALIFTLHLHEPISTAYFFPLLQLHRLLSLLWSTLSFRGVKDLRSPEKSTFFSLMAAAVETAPHLQVQFTFFLLRFSDFRTSKVIWLSLAASFFSGTINGALAIDSIIADQTPRVWHQLSMFIASGFFTSSVLALGCLSFIGLSMWKGLLLRISFLAVVPFVFLALYLALWKEDQETNHSSKGLAKFSRFFRLFVFGYVSLTIGPIFPLAYHAKGRKELGKRAYWFRLVIATALLLAYYLSVFVISFVGPLSSRWLHRCVEVFHDASTGQFPCWFFVPTAAIGLGVLVVSTAVYILLDRSLESELHFELESDLESMSSSSTHPLYSITNEKVSTAKLAGSPTQSTECFITGNAEPSIAGNLRWSMNSRCTFNTGTDASVRNTEFAEGARVMVMQRSSSLPWRAVNCMGMGHKASMSYGTNGHFHPLVRD